MITARRKNGLRSTDFCGNPSVSTKPGSTVCTRTPRSASRPVSERENASCACLEAAYGPGGGEGDGARDRDDVDDVRAGLQRRFEGTDHPDAAEIVRPQHRLDPLGLEREEGAAARDAGVVDEQVDAGMPLQDRRGGAVDVGAVRDIADLVLAAQLGREPLEPVLPARDEHRPPAAPRQLASRRLADAAGRAGDDGDLHAGVPTGRRERRAGLQPCGPWRR